MTSGKRVLLSGSNGFVGAGVLHHLLRETDWTFILPTTSTHHGSQTRLNQVLDNYINWNLNLGNPKERMGKRVSVVHVDLSQPFDHSVFGGPTPDYILNIASESHVDRSIEDPRPFIRNNVDLMVNVLEYAREVEPRLLLQMSTDEVYGDARPDEYHAEWSDIRPSNPYSASKAAQEAIAYSYWRTYNVPLVITNTMNLICPPVITFQDEEKFVPMVVNRLLGGQPVSIHVDDEGRSGSRCWIDVRDFADAWLFLIRDFEAGHYDPCYMPNRPHLPLRVNIVGEEMTNREIAEFLAGVLGKQRTATLVDEHFHQTRPGHDPRYALDGEAMRELGWEPKIPLEKTLRQIAASYLTRES